MEYVVNIHTPNAQLELLAGDYIIDVLGGFGVTLGQFAIGLRHLESGEIFACKRSKWPIQGYAFGKRKKRVLSVALDYSGLYEIQFTKPETLNCMSQTCFYLVGSTISFQIRKFRFTFILCDTSRLTSDW